MSENKKNIKEKRQHERAPVKLEVTFQSGEDLVSRYMSNISRGGVYINTSEPHDLDTEIDLSFTLPESGHKFVILGKVVWNSPSGGKTPPGMGIQFREMPEEDAILIEGYLQAQSKK